jgi:hypothetical protein
MIGLDTGITKISMAGWCEVSSDMVLGVFACSSYQSYRKIWPIFYLFRNCEE